MSKYNPDNNFVNHIDELGRFIFMDFDHQRPFSSFLPGIAGLQGIPMWVFYVNRGQAICSFGVENKDHPILEFQAANKAYQSTSLSGFRTFLNGIRDGKKWNREIFSPWQATDIQRTMFVGMNEVEIQEINTILGYQINVLYFMLPQLPFSGLVRKVSLKNLHQSPLKLEVLDGLPGIVPYGVEDGALKNVARTIEAWMRVINLENNLPFYQLKATPGDTAAVHAIQAGNYALAFQEEHLLPVIADPTAVFGLDTSHSGAHLFHDRGLKDVLDTLQTLEGRTLCAFFGAHMTINPGEEQTITSLYGYSRTLSSIDSWISRLMTSGFFDQKLQEARRLTDDLTNTIQTETAFQNFDGYCRQTFLDNLLRGGFPLVLGDKHVTHIYSRKHGDIERDYNYFIIPAEYYSQGNGNYRDVNQNRRNDVSFVPQSGAFNIRLFMSLIQADGYNPLVINGLSFTIAKDQIDHLLAYASDKNKLEKIFARKFKPGELLDAVKDAQISIPEASFMDLVFSQAESHIEAAHGEGYWIDHWTYNLDLIESYLAIYPDKKIELLFQSNPLPFYDNSHVVQPRKLRFVRYHGEPRQLNAVDESPEKAALIKSRSVSPNWARADQGKGKIYQLPLFSKLALLALIKVTTLDPSGMGIQMEAGRPGWYDALNGLPGLFGSSMPETYELLRLVNFLSETLDEAPRDVPLPIESQILIDVITEFQEHKTDPLTDWNKMSKALETYRESIKLGFDGATISVNLQTILMIMRKNLKKGISKAHSFTDDIPATYFIHEVTDYILTGTHDENGNPHIQVKSFKPVALPPFLEGPVRLMKISSTIEVQQLAQTIKKSRLFDKVLGMYKVNASLSGQPHEIGRARAFTPGWLENESIWLHMAFKYLLELQKAGLYDEFFTALATHLPAFMDPDVYGRSPLENSSFIVSSAHPDKALHGNGFVARLSGSTAEFLTMWVLMTAGQQPFRLENDQLILAFQPSLPGSFFKEDGSFTFRFLGSCTVTVHNPSKTDTYSEKMKIKKIELHSSTDTISIDGSEIKSPYADEIRLGKFDSIDLFY